MNSLLNSFNNSIDQSKVYENIQMSQRGEESPSISGRERRCQIEEGSSDDGLEIDSLIQHKTEENKRPLS